jgi:CHAT domain-containing protein
VPESSETRRLPTLPPGTALVSYWLGTESAYAWVIRPGGIRWARLPSPATIAERAAAFHRSLSRLIDVPLERRLEEGRELYKLVLEPIDPWLEATQWVVVPDGALDYVPFGALRAGQGTSFVAMRHDVALAPAAWTLASGATRTKPHGRSLLLVADPVYQADDPRLRAFGKAPPPASGAGQALDAAARNHRRLAFTGAEAEGILEQFRPGDTDALVGLDATRDRVLALDWSGYRYIHFAAHAMADTQVPELSSLILGNYDDRGRRVEGTIRLADLSLRTLSADVAVFSACDTSLGKAIPGEGLVGISSTMLARGAQAVVASLWPVVDEIGARLMTEFYRHLLRDSMSPVAALGAAMRSEAAREPSADPALWAAYQVFVRRLQATAVGEPREPSDRQEGDRKRQLGTGR